MSAYDQIWDEAEEHFGLITASAAKKLGVSKQNLSALASRGMITALGHGVYQVKHHIPGQNDVYAIGVAQAGPTAYLRSASVIALLNLAPTCPGLLYIGATGRVRRRFSESMRLRDRHASPTEEILGIRCQRVYEALKEAENEGSVEADRVADAARRACEEGYITHEECAHFKG